MKLREYMKRTPQLVNWKLNNFRIIATNAFNTFFTRHSTHNRNRRIIAIENIQQTGVGPGHKSEKSKQGNEDVFYNCETTNSIIPECN